MKNEKILKEIDHHTIDDLLSRVLDAYKNDELSKEAVIGGLANVMAALDIGNSELALDWINQEGIEKFNYYAHPIWETSTSISK